VKAMQLTEAAKGSGEGARAVVEAESGGTGGGGQGLVDMLGVGQHLVICSGKWDLAYARGRRMRSAAERVAAYK
jgi:hypothetical protein